jgi:MoxR-like ATPase
LSSEAALGQAQEITQLIEKVRKGEATAEEVAKRFLEICQQAEEKGPRLIIWSHDRGEIPDKARERPYEPSLIIPDLKEAMRQVSLDVIGREEIITQALLALLTREHQMMISRAGTAKSLLASSIFSQFSDAYTFSIQMTKGTTEESLVGAYDLEKFKTGTIWHNVSGSIVEAEFAFIDEIFDSNDVSLRSLLGILNERQFRKGKQHQEAVLHTAIATSNYQRASEVTEAVIDRFPFRSFINPEPTLYQTLLIDQQYEETAGGVIIPTKKVSFDQLDYLADVVEGRVPGRTIEAPASILFLKALIIAKYIEMVNKDKGDKQEKEVYISSRTIAKTRDVLNAAALLRGRTIVSPEDLAMLEYMITTVGTDEQGIFRNALKEVMAEFEAHPEELSKVDRLMEISDILGDLLEMGKTKTGIDLNWKQKVLAFLGLMDLNQLSLEKLHEVTLNTQSDNPEVQKIKKDLLARIELEQKRRGKDWKGAF